MADLPVAVTRPAEAAPGTGRESTDEARLADSRTSTSRDGSASTREGPATTTTPQSSGRPAEGPPESATATREKRRRRSRWEAPGVADAVVAGPSDRADRAVAVVPTAKKRATDDARRGEIAPSRDADVDVRARDASPAGLLLLPGGVLAKLPVSFLCERDAPAGADEATRDAFAALARVNRLAIAVRGSPAPSPRFARAGDAAARTRSTASSEREHATETVTLTETVRGSRSPSPEPTYGSDGARVNTRAARAARKREAARAEALETIARLCPSFRFPDDYAKPRKTRKIFVPAERSHPGQKNSFFGLIVGPRGNTQKQMQREFGVKIVIRGRGSEKKSFARPPEADAARAAGGAEEEPMHVLVTGDDDASVDAAAAAVARLLEPLRDEENEHKRAQLRELAVLNGTLREDAEREKNGRRGGDFDEKNASAVGAAALPPDVRARVAARYEKDVRATRDEARGEVSGDEKEKARGDDAAYRAFLAEIGVAPATETGAFSPPEPSGGGGAPSDAALEDRRKAYVGRLPPFANEHTVRLTFAPFGAIEKIEVVPDRETNAPCRGFAFVLFFEESAARAAATHFERVATAFPHPPPPGFSGPSITSPRAMDVRVKSDGKRPAGAFHDSGAQRLDRERRKNAQQVRLYVAGLAPSFTSAALRSLVSKSLASTGEGDFSGETPDRAAAANGGDSDPAIVSCDVVCDRTTGLGRGFAFVRLSDARAAALATAALDSAEVEGRRIVVRVAEEKRENDSRERFRVRAPRGDAYGSHTGSPADPAWAPRTLYAPQGLYAHYDLRAVAAAEAAVAAANPALAAAAAAEIAAFATEAPGAYAFAPPPPPPPPPPHDSAP